MTKNSTLIKRIFIFILLVSLFQTIGFAAPGSDTALQQGESIWSSNNCICSQTYTSIRPKNEDGRIVMEETTYSNPTVTNGYCVYVGGPRVPCNSLSGGQLMDRYVDAGIISTQDADKFVADAEMYAAYVQTGLATKTQTLGGGFTNLGTGNFDRAMFNFNQNAHFIYSFLIGFAFITSLLVFTMIFIKISWLPDYPMQRRVAMEDIVTSGVATVLLGGIWVIISLFQSIFDNFWSTYAVYSKDWRTVGNMFLFEYKGLITGILGIAALTALLMFVKNFIGLTTTGESPNERKQKVISLLLTGVATAGLGGLTIFTGFFWNMLN